MAGRHALRTHPGYLTNYRFVYSRYDGRRPQTYSRMHLGLPRPAHLKKADSK